ncbi:MAG: hypothetical protein GX238_11580 [Epulopiscium sp.]|nr:hypothetical protein [Candidatus Epulonipiscium sp.]
MKKLRRNVVILLSTTMMLVAFMPRAGIAANLGNAKKSNTSKVLVDGVFKKFEAYTIESNNYFKLRDVAMVLNGTR